MELIGIGGLCYVIHQLRCNSDRPTGRENSQLFLPGRCPYTLSREYVCNFTLGLTPGTTQLTMSAVVSSLGAMRLLGFSPPSSGRVPGLPYRSRNTAGPGPQFGCCIQ